jgi:hypothetical protein
MSKVESRAPMTLDSSFQRLSTLDSTLDNSSRWRYDFPVAKTARSSIG